MERVMIYDLRVDMMRDMIRRLRLALRKHTTRIAKLEIRELLNSRIIYPLLYIEV
jgi:hypothetical protein